MYINCVCICFKENGKIVRIETVPPDDVVRKYFRNISCKTVSSEGCRTGYGTRNANIGRISKVQDKDTRRRRFQLSIECGFSGLTQRVVIIHVNIYVRCLFYRPDLRSRDVQHLSKFAICLV